MRLFLYILWILLVAIGVSFAVLNSYDIHFDYFFAQKIIYFPLFFVMLLFVGVVLGFLIMLPTVVKLKAQLLMCRHKAAEKNGKTS